MNLLHIEIEDRSLVVSVGSARLAVELRERPRWRWSHLAFDVFHGHHRHSFFTPLVTFEVEWWDRDE